MNRQITTSDTGRVYTLDPVTFEVLKNSFTTIVDQMAEQNSAHLPLIRHVRP